MFGLYCKRLQSLVPSCSLSVHYSVTHFIGSSYSSKSSSSLVAQDVKGHSFAASYLMNSFGLSPELALSLSKKRNLHFKSPEKPDLVVRFLKDHGFSDTQMSIIFRKFPNLLLADVEKTLLPKLEFLNSIGVSGTDLADIITFHPHILAQSLDRMLRPCYDILKSIPIPDEMVPVFFKHSTRVFGVKFLSNLAPNISVLREVQVPESFISFWVAYHPRVMSPETKKFRQTVDKIIGMGIPQSSYNFMKAVQVISEMGASIWDQRMEFYRQCGWSGDDFLLAFRKNPMFMSLSEKKCSSKIDFLVNKMGWQHVELAECPDILTHSLEKSIIPKCSVYRVLQCKGLMKEGKFSINALIQSRQCFLERFVIKYQEQAPELSSIFQGEMTLAELGLGFEGRDGVKPMEDEVCEYCS